MAYNTSKDYKELIYNEDSEQSLNISINGEIIDYDYVRELKLKDDVFQSNEFKLGSANISQITLSLDNDLVKKLNGFKTVDFEFVLTIDEESNEKIPLGTYYIKSIDNSNDSYTKYTLYDMMDKFDDSYDASSYVPCTRYELLEHICEDFGVELESENIVNGEIEVSVYDNTINARKYLEYISERAGGFAKIVRNKLRVCSFSKVDKIEIDNELLGNYKTSDKKTITGVTYYNATQLFSAGNDSDYMLYLSQDSPFSCSQEEVDTLFSELEGLQFQSAELQIWGDPSIDTGDVITIGDIVTFAQKDWSFANGFYGNYKTPLNLKQNSQNTEKKSSKEMIKKIKSIIDEEQAKVEILAQKVDDNSSNIGKLEINTNQIAMAVESTQKNIENNYFDRKSVESLVANAESGIINTFSEAGGNNIFRNTNFSATDVLEEGQLFEFWYGNVVRKQNTDAANGYSIMLQNNTLYQEETIANGKYTISFYYKILNSLANVKVAINDKEYELKNSNSVELFQTGVDDIDPINILDNHITLSFICDTDNAAEVYDIMGNAGSVKLAYSQNQNETVTDTVNIGKGISITSSNSKVKLIANHNEICIKNTQTNEKPFNFNESGGEANNMVVKDEFQHSNLLDKKVDEQVWTIWNPLG